MNSKCRHCGKKKGDHKGIGLNCPIGRKTRIGYITFHNTQRFAAKQ